MGLGGGLVGFGFELFDVLVVFFVFFFVGKVGVWGLVLYWMGILFK